ncbi:hypothetical protein EDC30_10982 [Paucimonas lemoignei]|uniref:Uncharacterized protein n=1 Tax=Paucimonas lemoignei TaxID=29443 RepID=A0A4R3HTH9_PAULE|nr:hypothetical protein [Paucimonas lemoignei]TCS35783.1 hypothetical protein EDC30_10982 [Paucimonas lemoignei]
MSKPSFIDLQIAVTVIVVAGMLWFFLGGGMEQKAVDSLQEVNNKVASDAVTRYQMVKRNGSLSEICVEAGFVASSYLQAKDEPSYKQWKQTERDDCARAGISN